MNLKNKPQGYVSGFASHGDPAYSPPPIKLIQVKEQETLLGANMKSFIKQRLFGNFINYTKFYNARKYNFTPPVSSLTEIKDFDINGDPMRSAPTIRQNFKHRINDLRSTVQKKIQERYANQGQKHIQKSSKNRLSHRNSLGSNLQQSVVLNSQRSRVNKTYLAKRSLNGSRLDKNQSYDFEKYPAPSFISAIEDSFQQNSKVHHSGRKQVRLSPINNKAEMIKRLQNVKNNLNSSIPQIKKSQNRLQNEKFDIKQAIWELFCQPPKIKNEKMQIASSVSKDLLGVNESFISSIQRPIDIKTNELSKHNYSFQKPKLPSSRDSFMKQSFLQYLNNPNITYPPLANLYSSFFQINPKLYDSLKSEQYKSFVEPLVTSSARVWAVSSFRFWDVNQDGVICSKDIFSMYQTLDSEQIRLKESLNSQDHKGYKTVLKLKEILEELRQTIIQINFDWQLRKNKTQRQDEDKYDIKYLQQALLRKKQLKYSDLVLILGQNIKLSTKEIKKSVIDSAKQLNMKFSSCYRYSFLATDHNQQTREDRQHIQNLKQQLRKEKMQIVEQERAEVLQNGKIVGLNYKTYYQKQFYAKIKILILDLFAIHLL